MASSSSSPTRRLVTVRRVGAVSAIPGADRIELAEVDGWRLVVGRGEFSSGDPGLFFEIDCFLPAEDARWGFLAGANGRGFVEWRGGRGFRVRSVKMRGQVRVVLPHGSREGGDGDVLNDLPVQVSQGLLMPLAKFPEIMSTVKSSMATMDGASGEPEAWIEHAQGQSFEELLGVRKWEPDEATEGRAGGGGDVGELGPFPAFLRRTQQDRCQNVTWVFARMQDAEFQESTKMDGSSMTAYRLRADSPHLASLPTSFVGASKLPGGARFGVCSRNVELLEEAAGSGRYWEAALAARLPEVLDGETRDLAVQGELCGSGVQGNREGFPPGFLGFFVFAVFDIDAQRYMPPREAEELAARWGLRHVPLHGYRPLREIASNVAELLQRAEGKGINGKRREGIVLKVADGSFGFKAISNSYLLKHDV
ncbi:hypothetical protein HK405_006215 [Cladochytrium tenue]|nr:hypothetical protein HK405_006215 [Cladochytrium tenue]